MQENEDYYDHFGSCHFFPSPSTLFSLPSLDGRFYIFFSSSPEGESTIKGNIPLINPGKRGKQKRIKRRSKTVDSPLNFENDD